MIKQQLLWTFIQHNMEEGIAVMLMYVMDSKGSSPGRRGFAMAVNPQGETHGSIGGGIMEHKFVEKCIADLHETSALLPIVRKQVHDKEVAHNQSGMICSGEQTIFIYPVKIEDKIVVDELVNHFKHNKTAWLQLRPDGISLSKNDNNEVGLVTKSDIDWLYFEKIGYANQLHIIGGGHCALALSKLMSSLDFYISLHEDRGELDTLERNHYANEMKILQDYHRLSTTIEPGENVYIVIMTVGYRTDYIALKALLHKSFKYLGVLGSKKKMEKLLSQLQNDGIEKKTLDKIHTPIGISINSQTPEEIAISIAAEIILIKNKIK